MEEVTFLFLNSSQNSDGLFFLRGYELVTPPLDGMILPGVTRDSVLTLAREHASGAYTVPGLPENITVTERPVTMKEVKEASHSGKLVEMFGAGAYFNSCTFDAGSWSQPFPSLQVPPRSLALSTGSDTRAKMSSSQLGKMAWVPSHDTSGPN